MDTEAIMFGDGFEIVDPNVDPDPGITETPTEALARVQRENRRLKIKAAAANRKREHTERRLKREADAHQADVADIFNRVLAAELEGRSGLPVADLPDILAIEVDEEIGAMAWPRDSHAISSWISARHPGRYL